jgi:hypothetical protein
MVSSGRRSSHLARGTRAGHDQRLRLARGSDGARRRYPSFPPGAGASGSKIAGRWRIVNEWGDAHEEGDLDTLALVHRRKWWQACSA